MEKNEFLDDEDLFETLLEVSAGFHQANGGETRRKFAWTRWIETVTGTPICSLPRNPCRHSS